LKEDQVFCSSCDCYLTTERTVGEVDRQNIEREHKL